MIPWCESKDLATGTPDEAVEDTSCQQSIQQLSDRPYVEDNNRQTGTWFNMLYIEDEKLLNDSISSNNKLLPKEPCSSFYDEDHVEQIKEFQFYVDTVKKIVRPGCSPETLDVALSSISSLLKILSVISSERYMHASL
ncbi:hypothetical protein CDL12_11479 [Handroanthus impetiginosus]|uniref:Uncharacterized protein n=1 Tax=Handroanthus impetiginosus TaxID=429701 RepID=A0A2G9HEC7_9LAMI|nr:hypothetical protein CDL12_11479 [Handroanthus impetiginosus]